MVDNPPPPFASNLPAAASSHSAAASASTTGKRQFSTDDDDGPAAECDSSSSGPVRQHSNSKTKKRPSREHGVVNDDTIEAASSAPIGSPSPRGGRSPLGSSPRRTNDEIHTTIDLCPVTVALIDTPSFQRLRGIKQLGTAEYAYVNATTTRFEHSLGVSELARRMVSVVADRQPHLMCTPKDVLCVKLAGLLHDVGHGPFSHVYEQFQACLAERLVRQPHLAQHYDSAMPPLHYTGHEAVSLRMIDQILLEVGVRMDLTRLDDPLQEVGGDDGVRPLDLRAATQGGVDPPDEFRRRSDEGGDNARHDSPVNHSHVLTTRDWVFIKECIWGKPVPEYEEVLGPGFHGRPPHKEWLYDVVCNRHSGLDVDKIDYYARDERRAFKGAGEIDFPMIHEARVAWAACNDPHCHKCANRRSEDPQPLNNVFRGRHLMVCYPDKLVTSCMDFFKKRFELHTKIYSHKTTVGVSFMICDILCAADPYFRIPVGLSAATGTGQAKCEYDCLPVSRACLDPPTYVRCRDSIIDQIANTTHENLSEARNLIRRLWSRDMYKCAICKVLDMEDLHERRLWSLSEHDILEGILQVRGVHRHPRTGEPVQLGKDDVLVHRCNIHHGSKDRNPVLQIRFLEKWQLVGLSSRRLEELPEAAPADESRCRARLPRTFQENSVRVYARDPAKQALVRHVFDQWLHELHGEMELTEDLPGSDAGAPRAAAMMCSQESDDDCNDYYDDRGRLLQSPPPNVRPTGDFGQVTPVSRRYHDN